MSFTVNRKWLDEYTLSKKGICGITKPQLKILGIEGKEFRSGWMERVAGRVISNASEELFRQLHSIVGKKNQSEVIRNFKDRQKTNLRNRSSLIGVLPKEIRPASVIRVYRKCSVKMCKEKHNRLVQEERSIKERVDNSKIIIHKGEHHDKSRF